MSLTRFPSGTRCSPFTLWIIVFVTSSRFHILVDFGKNELILLRTHPVGKDEYTCRVNHSSKALCKRTETAFVLMCNIILFEIYFKKRTEHLIKVNKNTRKFKCGMFLINALGKYKGKAPLTFSFWSVYFFLSVSNCPDDHLQCSWVIRCISLAPWCLTAWVFAVFWLCCWRYKPQGKALNSI